MARTAAVCIACLVALPAAAQSARILAHHTLDFDLAQLRGRQVPVVRLEFTGFGRGFALELDNNAALLDGLDATVRASANGADNLFLRGQLLADPEAWARLSRIDGRWTGGFFDGTELYPIDDAANVVDLLPAPAAPASTVICRFNDLLLPGLVDDVLTVLEAYRPERQRANFAQFLVRLRANLGKAAGAARELRLSVVTDTEYSAVHTTSASAATASRVDLVDGMCSAQLGTQITATTVRNPTDNGTLPSPTARR